MQLLFFLLVPFQDFFATMSSDEVKADIRNPLRYLLITE